MRISQPQYYDRFRCIADRCPDSCCKEWDVEVDEASAARYASMAGDLGQALGRAMYRDEDGDAWFRVEEGRCPFWRTDGLCRIQAELGHEALCKTCREFPRLTHDYGDFLERGLSLSCPEAAQLILRSSAEPWETWETAGGEETEYAPEDMAVLLKTRNVMSTILEDESRSVPEALALGLLYAYRAQAVLDGEAEADFSGDAELSFGKTMAKAADTWEFLEFYRNLEILTDPWRQRLENPAGGGVWAPELRALARYGVERWWLQAISDFDLVGRAKMVIAGCLLVHFLGGDPVQTAQLYGKEIENDADNVDAILEGAYSSPALTDEKLLGWLLL